jgi:TRAP-type C4-dicarboxylate transport system permease small subunit
MDALENIAKTLSRWFTWVALAALSALLVLVAADILGAKLLARPVPGAMDLASLLALTLIGFSTTHTQLLGRHIKVDFVTMHMAAGPRRILRLISTFLTLVFFVLADWRLFVYALDLQASGESSMTANIPFSYFAFGLSVAFLPIILVLLAKLARLWKGEDD